jgi:hypothetical protein
MEESLKSLKLLFGILVTGTTAVAAFLIGSPDASAPYRVALDEIDRLITLREQVEQYRDETIARLNDHQFPELVQAMIPTKPLPGRSIPDFTIAPTAAPIAAAPAPEPASVDDERKSSSRPDPGNADDQEFVKLPKSVTAIWGSALAVRFEQVPIEGTLRELYLHLNEREWHHGRNFLLATYYFEPDAETFAKAFRRAIVTHSDCDLVSWQIENVSSTTPNSHESIISTTQLYSGQLFIDFVRKSNGEKRRADAGSVLGVWSCGSCGPERLEPLFGWLEKKGGYEGLYIPRVTSKSWFPKLRSIWSEIDDMGIDEADRFIQASIESKTQIVSLFGVTVSIPKLLFVYPLGIVAMIWMLWLHSIRLNTWCANRKTDLRETVGDQWFVFFDGRSPMVIYVLCTCIVPLCIFTRLVTVFFSGSPWIAVIVGLVGGALYAHIARQSIESLNAIRELISESQKEPSPVIIT